MSTVLDRLVDGLRAAARSNGDSAAPEVVIWPDRDSVWMGVMSQIAETYETLILGDYEPENGSGPAYWIRHRLGLQEREADAPPLLYLPGVSQDDLRASDDCPEHLRPIVELQHRGVIWRQANGRDWTPAAFLQNREKGLGVEVSKTPETSEALSVTLSHVLEQSIAFLESKQPVTADLLYGLIQQDTEKTILLWLENPQGTLEGFDAGERVAFLATCRKDFGFDPESDGPIHAAGLLGQRDGLWKQVWARFREAPEKHPGVREVLRAAGEGKSEPKQISMEVGGKWDYPSAWPQVNEEEEENLRRELGEITSR